MPPGEAIEEETVDLSDPSADTPRNKRWLGSSIFNEKVGQILISLLIFFDCLTGIGGLCVLFVCNRPFALRDMCHRFYENESYMILPSKNH